MGLKNIISDKPDLHTPPMSENFSSAQHNYLNIYPARLENREGSIFLCAILGILIALTNAVRPLSQILLIAIVLCILPSVKRFDENEKMLNGKVLRASCQGWFLAIIVSFSFLVCSQLISGAISNTIAYKLPGSSVSFGYNLMVGVNTESKGAWNEQDADFFANEFALTNSPQAAHQASVNVAVQRIKSRDSESNRYKRTGGLQ